MKSLRSAREDDADLIAGHFPTGTRLTVPEGGMLQWLQLPEGASGDRLFAAALGRGIKIAPGSMFTAGRRFGGCIRLGCDRAVNDEVQRAARSGRALVKKPGVIIAAVGARAGIAPVQLNGNQEGSWPARPATPQPELPPQR